MNKLYLIASSFLFSLLLVTSCSESEATTEEPTPDPTPDPVSVSVSFTGSVASDTGFSFSAGDNIAVSAYDTDANVFASSVKYTYATGGTFSSSSPIEFIEEEDGKMAYLAVYPYMSIPTDKIASFTVESDQSTESNYNASDLMSSAVSSTSSATPALSFSRLLSSVVISIDYSEVETSGATATLSAVSSVEYNLSTLSATVPTSASSIKMLSSGDNFKAIVAPQTFEAGAFVAVIEVGGESYPVNLSSEVSVGGGQEVTIPVTIFDGTITVSDPIISDWTSSSFDNEESDDQVEDDGTPATISIADLTAPYSLYYSDLGGSRTIAVVSNKEQVSFEYDTSATWLSVSSVGSKQGLLALAISENDGEERSAVITITAGVEGNTASTELTINQGANGSSSAYAVGDLVYDEAGEANGIICYVSDDGTQVMALSFEVTYLPFASASLDSDGYDTGLADLYSNSGVGYADDCMAYLQSQSYYTDDYFPAFAWAASLGDGWYIPTRYDWITCIMPAFLGTETDSSGNYMLVTELNDTMVAAGGTSYDNNDYENIRYWTCSLADGNAGAKAYITKLCGNTTTKVAKTSATPYARAVKYVSM